MQRYIDGDYFFRETGLMTFECADDNEIVTKKINYDMLPLLDLYSETGNIPVLGYLSAPGTGGTWIVPEAGSDAAICMNHDASDAAYEAKGKAYEILGRMCHLLEDMSVPDHAHNTSHAGVYGMRSSPYEGTEEALTEWNAQDLIDEDLSFLDPYESEQPILYLMYYLNQIGDHYADALLDGDDVHDQSIG